MYRQGQLDSLCGVYSVINATKALKPKSSLPKTQKLFFLICDHLSQHKKSNRFLIDGITTPDVSSILKSIICPEFNLTYSKPYHRNAEAPLRLLWKTLYTKLNDDTNRVAIISFESWHYAHWTVVRAASHKRLTLFDSSDRKHLNRKPCSTFEVTEETPICFYPTSLFILEHQ